MGRNSTIPQTNLVPVDESVFNRIRSLLIANELADLAEDLWMGNEYGYWCAKSSAPGRNYLLVSYSSPSCKNPNKRGFKVDQYLLAKAKKIDPDTFLPEGAISQEREDQFVILARKVKAARPVKEPAKKVKTKPLPRAIPKTNCSQNAMATLADRAKWGIRNRSRWTDSSSNKQQAASG